MPVEVRSKFDPYTVWAESEYNLGRDLTIFMWLSAMFFGLAFLMCFILLCLYVFIIRHKSDDNGVYAKEAV